MHRVLAILLMLLIPLQVTWAAAAALHGHADENAEAAVFHYHDDDGHFDAHDDEGGDSAGIPASDDNDGDHREGHVHPVFTMFVVEPKVNVGIPQPEAHPFWPAQSFSSHIPFPLDRPPLAQR